MARGSWTKKQHAVPNAHQAMDNFKYEIASELGLPVKQGSEDYWGEVSSRDCGAVGGHMVRRMIQYAEQQLSQNNTLPTSGGTTSNMSGQTNSTNGSSGQSQGPESSYARGTTYNSGNQQSSYTTGNAGQSSPSTGTSTGSGQQNTMKKGQESSYTRGTTYNSNRK